MKNPITIISMLLWLIASSAAAQSEGARYGAHFGIGISGFKGFPEARQDQKLAFSGGIAVNKQFNKNFGINMNALFTGKGSRVQGSAEAPPDLFGQSRSYAYEDTYRFYFVEVPVLPKVSIGFDNLYLKIFGGPSINFALLSTQSREYTDQRFDESNGYTNQEYRTSNVVEYALVYGTGFDLETENDQLWTLDVRFSNALSKFGYIESSKAANRYFTVGIGYMY